MARFSGGIRPDKALGKVSVDVHSLLSVACLRFSVAKGSICNPAQQHLKRCQTRRLPHNMCQALPRRAPRSARNSTCSLPRQERQPQSALSTSAPSTRCTGECVAPSKQTGRQGALPPARALRRAARRVPQGAIPAACGARCCGAYAAPALPSQAPFTQRALLPRGRSYQWQHLSVYSIITSIALEHAAQPHCAIKEVCDRHTAEQAERTPGGAPS